MTSVNKNFFFTISMLNESRNARNVLCMPKNDYDILGTVNQTNTNKTEYQQDSAYDSPLKLFLTIQKQGNFSFE